MASLTGVPWRERAGSIAVAAPRGQAVREGARGPVPIFGSAVTQWSRAGTNRNPFDGDVSTGPLGQGRTVASGVGPAPGDVRSHETHDALQVVDRAELDDDPTLGPPDLHLDLRLEDVGEPLPQVLDPGRGDLAGAPLGGRLLGRGDRHGLLGGPHREP